ncbi:hypothetical protein D9M73_202840 [compost metagenome]
MSSNCTSRKRSAGWLSRTAMLWPMVRAMRVFHWAPTWRGSGLWLYICHRVWTKLAIEGMVLPGSRWVRMTWARGKVLNSSSKVCRCCGLLSNQRRPAGMPRCCCCHWRNCSIFFR